MVTNGPNGFGQGFLLGCLALHPLSFWSLGGVLSATSIFALWVPKFLKLGLLLLWRPITYSIELWSRWGLKQSYIPHQDLSNVTCMQINQGNFRLLVVKSQIATLISGLSFGNNLCFKYPNGSCEPILDI
jgi:hypothetical protein